MTLPRLILLIVLLAPAVFSGCGRLADVGRRPDFQPTTDGNQYYAMSAQPLPTALEK